MLFVPLPSTSLNSIAQLREQVAILQGTALGLVERGLIQIVPVATPVDDVLPLNGLPLGAVHEVHGRRLAHASAFAAMLIGRIGKSEQIIYIAPNYSFHPLGLLPFGVDCKDWIHIAPRRPADRVWAALEALRCRQVKAVLGVLPPIDLTGSRQLQLAAEESCGTCFLLGDTDTLSAASAATRWQIAPAIGAPQSGFDSVVWSIKLIYCRGGRPGKWTLMYRNGVLEDANRLVPIRKRLLTEASAAERMAI